MSHLLAQLNYNKESNRRSVTNLRHELKSDRLLAVATLFAIVVRRVRGGRHGECLTTLRTGCGQVGGSAEEDFSPGARHELIAGDAGKNKIDGVPRRERG